MKNITIKLYEFDELTPDVQKKVLDENRNINLNYGHEEYEDSVREFKQKLEVDGYENPDIHYSGFGSQGDGACFDADVNLIKMVNNKTLPEKYAPLFPLILDGTITATISKTSYANHYSHEHTRFIEVVQDGDTEELDTLQPLIDDMQNKCLEPERLELSKKLYKLLQDEYEYHTSDDAVMDTIRANDYMFESDGTMRNV